VIKTNNATSVVVPRMRTKIPYGGRRHIENRKIAITLQPFIRSRRNCTRTRRSWPQTVRNV